MEASLRSQILDHTTEIFTRVGLRFTMQEVAEEMHISKKTIYTEFPSKEALLTAMLDRGFGLIQEHKLEVLSQIKNMQVTVCDDCTAHYEYFRDHYNPNPKDCCNLRK